MMINYRIWNESSVKKLSIQIPVFNGIFSNILVDKQFPEEVNESSEFNETLVIQKKNRKKNSAIVGDNGEILATIKYI